MSLRMWLEENQNLNLWNQSGIPESNQPRNIYILKFVKPTVKDSLNIEGELKFYQAMFL